MSKDIELLLSLREKIELEFKEYRKCIFMPYIRHQKNDKIYNQFLNDLKEIDDTIESIKTMSIHDSLYNS